MAARVRRSFSPARTAPAEEARVPLEDLGGLRGTRQRRAVLSAVEGLGVFSSARAVHEAIESAGQRVGLSTVYRSLHVLAEFGSIDSIRDEGGETVYRKCAGQVHQHLLCRQCGAAEEFSDLPVRALVDRWSGCAGYREVDYVLEMYGTCPSCALKNDSHPC